jgi:hypothetical protein
LTGCSETPISEFNIANQIVQRKILFLEDESAWNYIKSTFFAAMQQHGLQQHSASIASRKKVTQGRSNLPKKLQ